MSRISRGSSDGYRWARGGRLCVNLINLSTSNILALNSNRVIKQIVRDYRSLTHFLGVGEGVVHRGTKILNRNRAGYCKLLASLLFPVKGASKLRQNCSAPTVARTGKHR